ncbi:MAG: hypothetical protein HYZ11_15775 [Candidatus Tectomicrobia bacterium]|uniref:Uncharacterized protein n=1 Tax=Tectimicrobiota bacterium TaxID=2528274 RepID=A0A932I366_UNCTE|nr:hypothetical protein [Candidatus Tectomicrobia bacterium]
MVAEPIEIVWNVDEPTEGLNDYHVWGMAVRSRRNEELTRLLDVLEINGLCQVVVFDASGRETLFPCELPSRQPARPAKMLPAAAVPEVEVALA